MGHSGGFGIFPSTKNALLLNFLISSSDKLGTIEDITGNLKSHKQGMDLIAVFQSPFFPCSGVKCGLGRSRTQASSDDGLMVIWTPFLYECLQCNQPGF